MSKCYLLYDNTVIVHREDDNDILWLASAEMDNCNPFHRIEVPPGDQKWFIDFQGRARMTDNTLILLPPQSLFHSCNEVPECNKKLKESPPWTLTKYLLDFRDEMPTPSMLQLCDKGDFVDLEDPEVQEVIHNLDFTMSALFMMRGFGMIKLRGDD
jgi:hypothetical protein